MQMPDIPCTRLMSSEASKGFSSISFLRLIFCAAGIYGFFLTWGVLQERISTMEYVQGDLKGRFKYFQVLNMIQAFLAALLASLQICWQRLPLCGNRENPQKVSSLLLFAFLKISVCSSVASSLGYRSLRHINYPTMILGKSCKLVPVMLMNFLIYRKRFELYKYATVGLITTGVSGFMMFEEVSGEGGRRGSGHSSVFGLSLLMANLLMDGATNSWQDQLFLKYRLKSQQLMMFMNLFSGSLLALSLIAYAVLQPTNSQLLEAWVFAKTHPAVLKDILAFSACGALGQLFIFYTLEHFGSLALVTITVTRKLFTILISLFWFNHHVNSNQWICVSVVFLALILEASLAGMQKRKTGSSKKSEAPDVKSIEDGKFLVVQDEKTVNTVKKRHQRGVKQ